MTGYEVAWTDYKQYQLAIVIGYQLLEMLPSAPLSHRKALAVILIIFLVFQKKDLYLVIMQKLIFLDFMKSGRFHMKSGGFHVKSTCKPYKSNNSRKTLQFYGVQWEGYVS